MTAGGWGTPHTVTQTYHGFDLGPRVGSSDRDLLAECIRQAACRDDGGWAIEFGVGQGETLTMLGAAMPTMGFDSFEGLPEDWRTEFPKGSFAQQAIPDVEGASITIGLFEDTLPHVEWPDKVSLIHYDADLYSSTRTALLATADLIKPGCFLVFDEFHGYDGCEDHEQLAFKEFLEDHQMSYRVVGHQREAWAVEVMA